MKFYTISKDYKKKFFTKTNEFCFDNESYSLLERICFSNDIIGKKWGDNRKIYYLSRGDLLPILGGTRTWLVNNKIIEKFEKIIGKDKLYTEVELLPIYLQSERAVISGENELINGYYIVNVLNKIKDIHLKLYNEDYEKNNFLMLDRYLNKIIFSEKVKDILEKEELKMYKVDWVYEF